MKTARTKIRMLTIGLTLAVLALTLHVLLDTERFASAAAQGQTDQARPATVDPGPGTAYLDPVLWGILQKHSIGADVPSNVTVGIDVRLDVTLDRTLADHIELVGGRSTGDNRWDIPTSKVLEIVQRGDVFYVTLVQDTAQVLNPRLNDTMNAIATAIFGGIPAADAVQYARFIDGDKVLVEVMAPDFATATSAEEWLRDQKVYIPRGEMMEKEGGSHGFVVLLPVGQLDPLLDKFATVQVSAEDSWSLLHPLTRSRWQSGPLEYSRRVVESFKPPGPEFYSGHPTPAAVAAARLANSETQAKDRHNVSAWHNEGYEGDVKVGIIDWGYADHDSTDAIPTLTKTTSKLTGPSYNAYCQSIYESIVPKTWTFFRNDNDCEPSAAFGYYRMRHGNNIAELIKRMAPDAELLLAQANSPRQVYEAATWLKSQGAKVIVHAGGWQYDSAGDGKPQMGLDTMTSSLGYSEHAEGRYFPSPLATVDHVTDEDGPVWVNAAGNHELWTMWLTDYDIINDEDDEKYHGYVVFNSGGITKQRKTCQRIPTVELEVTYYSMRWADSWPDGKMNLHYEIEHAWPVTYDHFASHKKSTDSGAYTRAYPVRRNSATSDVNMDMCLRIYVVDDDLEDGEEPAKPNWIQFQALVAKKQQSGTPSWRSDLPGRSVVNPSESDNPGLLAVGALSLGSDEDDPMEDWVSRGPVFSEGDDVLSDTPERIKPDVVASTDAATYTKWRWDCYEENKSDPQKADECTDLYFTGTSGATGHTGGIVAVVTEWFDDLGVDYGPADVANFIRTSAVPKTDSAYGLVNLPCFSEPEGEAPIPTTYGVWSESDCTTVEQTGAKSDFYTFYLDETQRVVITLSSSTQDSYLYLRAGPHAKSEVIAQDDNSGGGTNGQDAEVVVLLEKGIYTIEATAKVLNASVSGFHAIRMVTADPLASLGSDPSDDDFRVGYAPRSYTVYTSVPVVVVANPSDTDLALGVSTQYSSSTCTATRNAKAYPTSGQTIYIGGCGAGNGVLEMRSRFGNSLLNIYRINVSPR